MSVTIYHNPRCSKSRETLKLLEDKGVDAIVVEYMDTPPDVPELRDIIGKLGMSPRELLRKKEARESGLDDPDLSDDALLAGMIANPRSIERPIVVANNKAALGRPPENVLAIL